MKTKTRLIIIFTTIILVMQVFLISPLAVVTHNIKNYNQYVATTYVEGVNDVVTMAFPQSSTFIRLYNVTDQKLYTGFGSVDVPSSELFPDSTWTIGIYPLGFSNGQFNAISSQFIPKGTNVKFIAKGSSSGSSSSLSFNIRANWACYDYNGVLVEEIRTAAQTNSPDMVFDMQLNTTAEGITYCVPNLFGTISGDDLIAILPEGSDGIRFTVGNLNIQMIIPTVIREFEQAFLQNDLLSDLIDEIKGNSGVGTGDKQDEVDDLIDKMEGMEKPDADVAVDQADPFKVISPNEFSSFTNIFSSILDQEIIRNLILLAMMIALVSYVLYGKKG